MHIVFIDESGQPGGFDSEKKELVKNTSKYFTLGGFMIDADYILEIGKKLRKIKLKYGLAENHEIKWHTNYSKYGLEFEQYDEMRIEISKIIGSYKNSVIGIIMDKEICYKNKEYINTQNDLYAVALHLLMERCCMESIKNSKVKKAKPVLMIADSRKNINGNKLDKQLQVAYLRAKNMETYFIKFPNFAENIIFVDSVDFSGIQLADYCAGIVHKKFEMNDEKFFKIILPAIINKNNNIYGPGIKLYT